MLLYQTQRDDATHLFRQLTQYEPTPSPLATTKARGPQLRRIFHHTPANLDHSCQYFALLIGSLEAPEGPGKAKEQPVVHQDKRIPTGWPSFIRGSGALPTPGTAAYHSNDVLWFPNL
jgi:hypothetical protein